MNQKIAKYHFTAYYVSIGSDRVGYVHFNFWEGREISKTIPGKEATVPFDTLAKGDAKQT